MKIHSTSFKFFKSLKTVKHIHTKNIFFLLNLTSQLCEFIPFFKILNETFFLNLLYGKISFAMCSTFPPYNFPLNRSEEGKKNNNSYALSATIIIAVQQNTCPLHCSYVYTSYRFKWEKLFLVCQGTYPFAYSHTSTSSLTLLVI